MANPQAGVWEVVVEARRTSDAVRAPYTLSAEVLGAEVERPKPADEESEERMLRMMLEAQGRG